MEGIAEENNMSPRSLIHNYVVARQKKSYICIFQATYAYTTPARLTDDSKLRDLKPDLNWLTVGGEHLLPKPGVTKYPPLPFSLIYS